MKLLKRLTALVMAFCLTFALAPATFATITYETMGSGSGGYPSDQILSLFQHKSITQSGMSITLNYRLYVPDDYDPNIKYPVVLFLHGYGERGSDNNVQLGCGMMKGFFSKNYYKDHPCIIVAPQCPSSTQWAVQGYTGSYGISDTPSTNTFTEAIQLCKKAVEQTVADYSVDTNRLYVTGLSMGGYGTWNIITHYPDYFAAAVPLCGGADPNKASRLVDLPIWAFHGDSDPTVPVSGTRDIYNAIIAAGGNKIQYTEYTGADHYIWDPTYARADVWNWMFSQSKSGEVIEPNKSTDDLAFRTAALKAKDQSPLSDADKATVNAAISEAEAVLNGTDRRESVVTAAENKIAAARTLFSSELSASSLVIDGGAATEDRFAAAGVADGDKSTAWQVALNSGSYGNNIWVGYDAKKLTTFDGMEILWEEGTIPGDDQYTVQVSSDGVTWTNVSAQNKTVRNTTEYILNFAPLCGRYIRVNLTGSTSNKYFPKIYELDVYGKATDTAGKGQLSDLAALSRLLYAADPSGLSADNQAARNEAMALIQPLLSNQNADVAALTEAVSKGLSAVDVSYQNLALAAGVTAIATEFAYTDHGPANIRDGNRSNGWQIFDGVNNVTVSYNPSVWVGYDFGKEISFEAVNLYWENGSRPNAGQYTLQTSADGSTWTDVTGATYLGLQNFVDAIVFPEITTRYLRVNITGGSNGKYYPKLFEMGVYTAKEDVNYTEYRTMYGDTDCDGVLKAADLTLMARHVAGIAPLTDRTALANASSNSAGTVLADDLTRLARKLARLDG